MCGEYWYHERSLTHILVLKDGHPLNSVLLLCGIVVGINWNTQPRPAMGRGSGDIPIVELCRHASIFPTHGCHPNPNHCQLTSKYGNHSFNQASE